MNEERVKMNSKKEEKKYSEEGTCFIDPKDHRIVEVDRTFLEILEQDDEDLIGQPIDRFLQRFQYAQDPVGQEEDREALMIRKSDGERFFGRSWYVEGEKGLRFTLKALPSDRESLMLEGDLFHELSRDLLAVGDIEKQEFLKVNPSFCRTLGYTEEEVLHFSFSRFVHSDDHDALISHLQEISEGMPVEGFRARMLCKDGSTIWVEWSGVALQAEGILYAIGRKVDEEVKAKEKLQRSEDWFQHLFEGSPVAMLIHDGERVHDLNREAMELLGVNEKSELIDERVEDHYPIQHGKELLQKIQEAIHQGSSFSSFSTSFKCLKGTPLEVEVDGTTVNCDGKVCVHMVVRDVTKQKRAERELARREKEYRTIVEGIPEGIHMLAPEDSNGEAFRVEFVNEHFVSSRNMKRKDFVGKDLWEFLKERGSEELFDPPRKAFLEKRTVDYSGDVEYQGELRTYQARAIPILNERNECERIVVMSRDVTQQKRVEEDLQRREEEYRTIVEGVPVGVFMLSTSGTKAEDFRFDFMNQRFLEDRGMKKEELVGKRLEDVLEEKEAQHLLDYQRKAFEEKQPVEYEQKLYLEEGERCFYERVVPVLDDNGQCDLLIGMSQDITEKKEMEKELERIALIAKETDNLVIMTDTDGLIEWVNDAFIRLTGYTMEEAIGTKPGHLLQGEDTGTEEVVRFSRAVWEQRSDVFELLNYSKDGTPYWARIFLEPIFGERGELTGYFSIQTDVTERRRIEEQVRKSEKQFRGLVENMNEGVLKLDPQYRIEYVNDSFLEILGFERELLQGKSIFELTEKYAPQNLGGIRKVFEKRKKGEKGQNEFSLQNVKGEEVHLLASGTPIFDENGNFQGSIAIFTDLTERKELEREVLRAVIQTQESERKRFAEDLHDGIGQILSGAKMYLDTIDVDDRTVRKENLSEVRSMIETAISETRNITHDLMPNELRDFGLVKAVKKLLQRMEDSKGVGVSFDTPSEEAWLPENLQVAIYRIFQELIANVIKHSEADRVEVSIAEKEGRFHFHIEDNGVGFDPDSHPEGLGTTNIKRRADLYGGNIEVRSEPGNGTRVEGWIPIPPPEKEN